jgi:uncharacterized membrane protein HdeD (DUF308 family)
MTELMEPDVADVVARVGRHWGWILAFGIVTLVAGIAVLAWPGRTLVVIAVMLSVWLLFFGLMEIAAAFRLRSVGHRARARTVHAT